MHTVGVYGFRSDDLEAARLLIESALSIHMEIADSGNNRYFRADLSSGPSVQIRRNIRDVFPPWHPDYGLLLFIHGPAQESIEEKLHAVPGLIFLERKPTM
jgi:hypothetical protein